jgi:hypothetical protein
MIFRDAKVRVLVKYWDRILKEITVKSMELKDKKAILMT